jgi:hypothetical protein
MRKLLLAAAAAVAALTWTTGAFGAVSINFYDGDATNGVNPDYVGITNDRGVYYVGLTCFRENAVINPGEQGPDGRNDVGPGYIFATAAVLPHLGRWETKTRDYIDVTLSDPRNGGWGKFGMHTARSVGGLQEVQNGLCFSAGRSGMQPDFGAGVSSSEIIQWPALNASGEAELGIRVFLSRQENGQANQIARVTYRYKIDSTRVRVWTNVTSCVNGCSGLYVKEPKFTANDYWNTTQHTYLAAACTNVRCSNAPTWWPNYTCAQIYGSVSPMDTTSKCPDTSRQQAWFKYNTSGSISGDCYYACTWILAQAASTYDASATLNYWGIGWQGLDKWAVDEESAGRWGSDPDTHCNQSWNEFRRWEVGRWSVGSPDGSISDQIGFHGWTGGIGLTDCQNLLRLVPSTAVSYFNYFEYRFRIND